MTDPRFWKIMKFALIGVLIAVLIISRQGNRTSSTDFDTMAQAVTQAADMSKMQEADNQMLKRLYGLDGTVYDGIVLYYPTTNMGAEELLLVRMADVSQTEELKTAIEGRLATQKKAFDGYGADQTAMLEKSIITIRGNYALFISADDPVSVQQAFDKNF